MQDFTSAVDALESFLSEKLSTCIQRFAPTGAVPSPCSSSMDLTRISPTVLTPPKPCLEDAAQWIVFVSNKGVFKIQEEDGKAWRLRRYDPCQQKFYYSAQGFLDKPKSACGLRLNSLLKTSDPAPPLETQKTRLEAEERSSLSPPSEKASYRLLSYLGQGSFGKVYKAVDSSGRLWAVKQKLEDSRDSEDNMLEEAFWMRRCIHPCVVELHEVVQGDLGRSLAMPLATCTLAQKIKGSVSVDFQMRCLQDVHQAIAYIHRLYLVHLDVKPSNVFIFGKTAKLGDLGAVQTNGSTVEGIYVCTRPYRPPEMLLGCERVFFAMDAWSFGAMALQLALQQDLPFGKGGIEQVQLTVATLGIPSSKEVNAMLAPWACLGEEDAEVVDMAFGLWKSQSLLVSFHKTMEEYVLSQEIYDVAKGLLCYDVLERKQNFDQLCFSMSAPGRGIKRERCL